RRQTRTQRALREVQPQAPTSWIAFPPERQTILLTPALFILGSDSRTRFTHAPPPPRLGQGTVGACSGKFRFVTESLTKSNGGCDPNKNFLAARQCSSRHRGP